MLHDLPKAHCRQVTVSADDGSKIENSVSLPTNPSEIVMGYLFNLCEELHRAGSHAADDIVRRLLATLSLMYVTMMLLLCCYNNKISSSYLHCRHINNIYRDVIHTASINKDGCVQLRFDVRYLSTLLGGRCEPTPIFVRAMGRLLLPLRASEGAWTESEIETCVVEMGKAAKRSSLEIQTSIQKKVCIFFSPFFCYY